MVLVGDGVPVGLGVIEVVLEGLGEGLGVSVAEGEGVGVGLLVADGDGVGVGQSPNIIVSVSEVSVQSVSHGKLLVELTFDSDAVVPPVGVAPSIHLVNAHLI